MVASLKDEILRMAAGNLRDSVPEMGQDEIGIIAEELDNLRTALQDTLVREKESRRANQDLITAMSHDLRTPLTILNGYLEVLRLNRNPEMHEEYLQTFYLLADHRGIERWYYNKAGKKLTEQINQDPLTKIYNRRGGMSCLESTFIRYRENDENVAVVMMDIDHFKRINDAHGHHAGDTVLRTISALFSEHFPDCITFRLGGEEFGLIMLNIPFEVALTRIEQFRQDLKDTPMDLGHPVYVTASFGVTDELADQLDEMLQAADRLLYQAKQQGRDRICTNN